jgi:hypothetical protein
MDYAVEVIADSSEVWCGNALKFPTIEAAEAYAKDLWSRWTAVRSWRVVRIVPMGWMTVRIPVEKVA